MFSLPGGGFDKLRDRQFNFSLARGSGQATSQKALSGNVMITDPLSYYIYFSTSIPMLIRKNTKAFKTILEIISACREKPDREKLIRLYVTKAGDTIKDRISVEAIEGGAGVFYEMGYQAVVGNLKSSNHQLHQSDEIPGVYFFHSSSNKVWDETPFEFDSACFLPFDFDSTSLFSAFPSDFTFGAGNENFSAFSFFLTIGSSGREPNSFFIASSN